MITRQAAGTFAQGLVGLGLLTVVPRQLVGLYLCRASGQVHTKILLHPGQLSIRPIVIWSDLGAVATAPPIHVGQVLQANLFNDLGLGRQRITLGGVMG